jgi:glutamine synthetase
MAQTLKQFKIDVDGLIEKGEKKEIAIIHTIQRYIVESKAVLFEGDGYSEKWHQEAEKRGLPNLRTTPIALDAMVSEKAKTLFKNNNIYSHSELEARHEIELEKYIKHVQIEGRIMGELALNNILPAAIKYQNNLIENIKGLKEVGLKESSYKTQLETVQALSNHINELSELVHNMIEARKTCNNMNETRAKAIAYCDTVKEPYFEAIRYQVDKLESIIDDAYWTLPKYREMLFLK